MISRDKISKADIVWLPSDEDNARSLGDLILDVRDHDILDAAINIGVIRKSRKNSIIKKTKLLRAYIKYLRNTTPANPDELASYETHVWVSLVVDRDKHRYGYFDEYFKADTAKALAQRVLPEIPPDYNQAELIAAIVACRLFSEQFPRYRCKYQRDMAEQRMSTIADVVSYSP